MAKKNDYVKRQVDILSSLGLFYIILIALFSVPLMGAFVVVIIKGVVDFRYAIMFGGALIFIIILFYLVKLFRAMFAKIRQDGLTAKQGAKNKAARGEPVQISVFNGLITFTYGGQNYPNALPGQWKNQGAALLPHMEENQNQVSDVVTRLKELSELKNQGVINEDEFQTIKTKLIRSEK
ncbi:MAG: SHOCT domain-containing protein [Desulfobacterales bacterium]|nr:SHOCT domain-containing protein [Desulfobacterales bacterium]